MLWPERMLRVTMLVRSSDRERAIRELAALRVLHLKDHTKTLIGTQNVDIGTPLAGAEELGRLVTLAQALLERLPPTAQRDDTRDPRTLIEQTSDACAVLERELATLTRERELRAQQERLLDLIPYTGRIDDLSRSRRVSAVLVRGDVDHPQAFERAVGPLATLLFLPAMNDAKDRFGDLVVDLSALKGLEGTVADAREHLRQANAIAAGQQQRAQQALEELGGLRARIAEAHSTLQRELLIAQAPLHFGTTRRITIIDGFAPTRNAQAIRTLADALGALCETTPATHAPTALHNPGAHGFEGLLRMYGIPRYDEIDPTRAMSITFPLFFGLMLGDIGYGLLVAMIALWIRSRFAAARGFAAVLLISAASSVLFGILFGEFFGLSHIGPYALHHTLHRAEDFMTLAGIALGIGVVHINLGLLFGLVNECREDGIVHGVLRKGGWFALEAGIVLILASRGILPFTADPVSGYVLVGLAIASIWYGEGAKGLIELPSLFTHMLSYLRLAVIALSSVSIAFVVNDLGGQLVHAGGFAIVGGLLVIIIGHTVNLALGMLGPALHSLRLHYVEFFLKFYSGGGTPYRPFGILRGETWQ